jgi:UDP-4-amino-4,6-dideoxy-N-acetyl-beta-L-altrosamine transaminase
MAPPIRQFLPYGRQSIHADDITAVVNVLKSDFWTTGPAVDEFESAFAHLTGADHAIAVANGTAALHLSAIAAGLGPGSLAIIPDNTFIATANAARLVGSDVLLCDVDPDTGLMTPETLSAALASTNRKVDCVLPVHIAGQTVDITALSEVCQADRNACRAKIIEDASHAVGAVNRDEQNVGSCAQSTMTTFSFHPVKTIAAGEGGMITTNSTQLATNLRDLRSHGITRDPKRFVGKSEAFGPDGEANPWYYEAQELGFNYRLSDIHAALGMSQLRRLHTIRKKRSELVEVYDSVLEDLAPAVRPITRVPNCVPSWHLYVVLIDFDGLGVSRPDFMKELRSRGIGTQVHYIPLHLHPTLKQHNPIAAIEGPPLTGAEQYYSQCLSLPLFADMTTSDVMYVVTAIRDIVEHHGKAPL